MLHYTDTAEGSCLPRCFCMWGQIGREQQEICLPRRGGKVKHSCGIQRQAGRLPDGMRK